MAQTMHRKLSSPTPRVLRSSLLALLVGTGLLGLGGCAQSPAAKADPGTESLAGNNTSANIGTSSTPLTASGRRVPFSTKKEQISYATGVQTARNFARNEVEFDAEMVLQGMRDVQENQPIRLSEKQLKAVMQNMQGEIHRKMVANRQELSLKNRNRGSTFLEEFRKKGDVQNISGSVFYRVIKQGDGPVPGPEDRIVARYRGTLVDGTEFDATEGDRGSVMKLDQLVQGWQMALRQMPVGSRWEIVIPPNLGYGDRGVGGSVGPNETLVFDVELLSTQP